MKDSTLISSHPYFALPVGFQRICSEHQLAWLFGNMIPYDVRVEAELGSLANRGMSLNEEAWQDLPHKGE
jgi:hypothetical protein